MIKQLSEFVEKVSYVADQIGEFTKQHAAEIHRVTDLLTYNPNEPLIFSTGLFLMLFLGFTFVYMCLQRRLTARLLFVTAFSYYFYYKSSGLYFFLLALVTVSDFLLANLIHRYRERRGLGKLFVTLSIIIDLGLLGYFKYTNFFVGMVQRMLEHNFQPWDIFLPVGISFFTFQSLSYTIDVYRGPLQPLAARLCLLRVVLPSTGGRSYCSGQRLCTADTPTANHHARHVCSRALLHPYRTVQEGRN